MADDAAPLGPADLDALEIPLLGSGAGRLLVLAVSGGVDSMCLMHVASELAPRRAGTRIEVVTVDHGLRPGSAAEARFVAAEAAKLGLPHTTKVWTGEKPRTGIQAAARAARYRLLADARDAFGSGGDSIVLTAHTQDDQAETVLMRLARGSGIDGLSAMSPLEYMSVPPSDDEVAEASASGRCLRPRTFPLGRPFLGIAKRRLAATLRARGLPWREDESNADVAFERVRIRAAMRQLNDAGIGAEAIARSARRLSSAREVVARATNAVLGDERLAHVDPHGFVTLDKSIWTEAGRGGVVAVRVLAAAIRIVGAVERPISLQALEELAEKLAHGWSGGEPAGMATLGLCRVLRSGDKVIVVREEGRQPPAALWLAPGREAVFDRRFKVSLSPAAAHGYEVRCLGVEGLRALRDMNACPQGAPAEALRLLPGFWTDAGLAAAPSVAGLPLPVIGAECRFLGTALPPADIRLAD